MAEGGIPYTLEEIDIFQGANRSPAFLAVNPFGWLPEGSVYGFTGPWYWTGLLCHELGHVYGYGHKAYLEQVVQS